MSLSDQQFRMLAEVAKALGPELRDEFVFVGGCKTGLMLTDPFTREGVRATDDVDLIVSVAHYAEWQQRKQALKRRGFEEPGLTDDEMPICAMKLGQLRVDVMPDAEHVLGFTNTWYARAVERAWDFELEPGLSIKLVTPDLFLATKLVAFRGRGQDDALQSRDVEDIINIIDGRPGLAQEVQGSEWDIQRYIAEELGELMARDDFAYMVQSDAGDQDREDVIFERLESIMNSVCSAGPSS